MVRAVLDTNVIVAALRSSRGASHELLYRMDSGAFRPVLSVPLVAEYEDVLFRSDSGIQLDRDRIEDVLNRICQLAVNQTIHFLWRPFLPDPKDDMVFEAALASGSTYIVTFNITDFHPAGSFGIQPIKPDQFLLTL
ncbi:MAG: PIN domain-containing protein [Verrucomicrobia bacterium]|nr:PIN domain-containing protein [Verrucomicrobiota bacterium]